MSPTLEPHDYIGLSAAAAASPTPTSSSSCSSSPNPGGEVEPRLTLRLGLPGSESPDRESSVDVDVAAALTLGPVSHKTASKRAFPDASPRRGGSAAAAGAEKAPSAAPPAAKAQVVGWPPVRNYRKNTLAATVSKTKVGEEEGAAKGGPHYVKVSMDGAPYLRKVDLKMYSSYEDLSTALQKMFSCFITGQSALRKPSTKDRLTNGKADSLQDQEYVLTYEDKDADWMLVGDLPWDLFTTICRKLKIMRGSDAAGIAPRSLEQRGQNK